MKTADDHTKTSSPSTMLTFDPKKVREDFPILQQKIFNHPLVYLDNAATSQKPQCVIDSISKYYTEYNSNVHRGIHFMSQKATDAFEEARVEVQHFINAKSDSEIVFVRGTTEAINLVAGTYGRQHINEGDEIIVSEMEHHSNIIPWQLLCLEKKAKIRVAPMNDDGELIYEEYEKLFNAKTKFVAITYVSNSLGTINPINKFIAKAHQNHVPVLVDAAQAVPHLKVDVQKIDCDFLVFSGHKMCGPTGSGVLFGKLEHFELMPPYHGGGEMMLSVTFEKTIYKEPPFRFEAGTPNIADVIALGEAIRYMNRIGMGAAFRYEEELTAYGTQLLKDIPGLKIIGTASTKTPVLSFVLEGINAMDAGMYLDTLGIAVRTGHHCNEPVMKHFGIPGTIRASMMFYNTKEELNFLREGIMKTIKLLRR